MKDKNEETAASLQKWYSGDEQGLNAILERHLPWIRAQVRQRLTALLRIKGDSGDYVQDAVLQFLRFGPRIMIKNEDHFRAFLLKVVENTLNDKYDWYTARRRNIAQERPLPSDTVILLDPPKGSGHTPSRSAERHEREAWVRLGLELLDPEDRELLILRKWDKLSFSKLGDHLGISEDAARMRYNRTVIKLGDVVLALRRGELGQFIDTESTQKGEQ
ncbi:MAG: RNA polymerase sigma factor [Planctomycetota bacterium]|jgi:RNA polymerase sigma-70 factor (ECF subfamily)